ncbi:hypothetical protein [Methanocaldococcus sp.]
MPPKKLFSKKGQLSVELAMIVASASLIAIIMAYYLVRYGKEFGEGVGSSGKKAEHFINTTNNNSAKYVQMLNKT